MLDHCRPDRFRDQMQPNLGALLAIIIQAVLLVLARFVAMLEKED